MSGIDETNKSKNIRNVFLGINILQFYVDAVRRVFSRMRRDFPFFFSAKWK
jgi:hypothetical protein